MFPNPRTKPPAGALVDWSNPLTRDLTFACLFQESSGRARDAVTGTPSAAVPGTWQGGPLGPAVGFNGTSNVANFGNNATWLPSTLSEFSFAAYANPSAESTTRTLIARRNTSTFAQFAMYTNVSVSGGIGSGTWGIIFRDATNVRQAVAASGLDGNWHFYSGSVRNGAISLYLDGVSQSTTSLAVGSIPVYAGTDPLCVGSQGASAYFNRSISHALFWRRPLTAHEHAQLATEPFAMFARSRPELLALTSFRAGWLSSTPVLGSGVY